MEATAVTMLHAASERADGNKAAMTEILFCLIRLIKPTWFNLYKRFLFPSRGAEEGLIFLLLPRQSALFLTKCSTDYWFKVH